MAFEFPEIDFGQIVTAVGQAGKTYLDYEAQRTQAKLAEQKIKADIAKTQAAVNTTNALTKAQQEVLSLHPELAIPTLYGGGSQDLGGYLSAFYKGASSPVYDPDSSLVTTKPTAVPANEGNQLSLILVFLGAFLLLK